MAGKFLEQMTSQLGSDITDTDLLYIRRPTADKSIRDIVVTWGELKSAMGIAVGTITSVFGRTSTAITAAASDYDASQVDNDSGVSGATVADALDTLATAVATKAAASQIGVIAGTIEAPGNGDIVLLLNSPLAITITSITTKSASGSCTATFKIDGTQLGGTANSVSAAEDEQTHSTDNVLAVGSDLSLTTSLDSSCVDMSFTIKYTTTLA